jgi:hypothetical protein
VLAKEEGHLLAGADEEQMAFEIHGLILALHYEARFLKKAGALARTHRGFENILARYAPLALTQPGPSLKSTPSNKE